MIRSGDYATREELHAAVYRSLLVHGEAFVERTDPVAPLRVVMRGE